MKEPKIIAIGDNVCDKYLSRGKMYPGGQCVNTCVYAKWNGVNSASCAPLFGLKPKLFSENCSSKIGDSSCAIAC